MNKIYIPKITEKSTFRNIPAIPTHRSIPRKYNGHRVKQIGNKIIAISRHARNDSRRGIGKPPRPGALDAIIRNRVFAYLQLRASAPFTPSIISFWSLGAVELKIIALERPRKGGLYGYSSLNAGTFISVRVYYTTWSESACFLLDKTFALLTVCNIDDCHDASHLINLCVLSAFGWAS